VGADAIKTLERMSHHAAGAAKRTNDDAALKAFDVMARRTQQQHSDIGIWSCMAW